MSEIVLKGIPAAPGIVVGRVFILDAQDFVVPKRFILPQEVPVEIARFEEVLVLTKEEITKLRDMIARDMGSQHAQIFEAHLMVLEDRTLIEDVIKGIKANLVGAEYQFSQVIKKYVEAFANIKDEYLKERTADINDIARRVLKNLMGESKWHDLDSLENDHVIVARDISPSDAVSMYNKKIVAFVTDIGGRTSHTAIIAKSLGVPAVVGTKDATLRIDNQDLVIVDGRKGLVILNPDPQTIKLYEKEQDKIIAFQNQFDDIRELPSETRDNYHIEVLANLELSEEVSVAKRNGAMGIGLYRTEFSYMNRLDLPTEQELFTAYKTIAERMAPQVVTIRTLDLGGDKFISSIQLPKEMSPFLGCRAIRFCMDQPDIFRTQLRAILRASAFGHVRLMYPMITGVTELMQANELLNEAKLELTQEGIAFNVDIPVGVMIEVPSAALTADIIAKEADFFSIGTNDLIQYTLAVDRVNVKTAHLYDPSHPGVIRLIKQVIDAARQEGIPVGLCGEAASEPALALLLVGLGVNELSMSPSSIPQIKKLIRSITIVQARAIAQEVLTFETGRDVMSLLEHKIKELVPSIFGQL